jgi:acetyl-CoA C-acetyltransferase
MINRLSIKPKALWHSDRIFVKRVKLIIRFHLPPSWIERDVRLESIIPMQTVFIASAGMTKFGKDPRPLAAILSEAGQQALADSETGDVDAIYIGAMNPEEFTGDSNLASQVADALGLTGVPAMRVETASSAGAAAVMAAFQAVAAGYYRRVLVVAGEKMTHLSTSATTRILAEVLDPRERACGATMPALAAMITEKYRQRFRLSESRLADMLCGVALKNHRNGARNPLAQFQRTITRRDYFASKFIATPLRLYDCAPITDGAAAVILTSEETEVRLAGVGQGTGPVSLQDREIFTAFTATQIAARCAYQMAETTPQAIDFAEIHDAFTPFEIITSEDLGFFPAGKGGEAVLAGRTATDGALPINSSGGLKARGHPVGASGLAQIVDVFRRLNGQTPSKRDFRRGLTQSTGGLGTNNFVTIMERADARKVASSWTPPPLPARSAQKRMAPQLRETVEGVIETFTIVHVTPDGFLAPLALALIRASDGTLLMAQGEDDTQLRIGQEVYVRRMDGMYLFTVKSQLQKVQEAFARLWRRRPAADKIKETRSGGAR